MTAKRDNRRTAIAQIHIAKKQLNLNDDTYRAALHAATGKTSCSDMAIGELYQALEYFKKCGFKATRRKTGGARRGKYSPQSTGQVVDKIRAIWIEMAKGGLIKDGSEQALLAWVKRQSSKMNGGIGVDSLEWLERDQAMASRVLESLKRWQKRVEA